MAQQDGVLVIELMTLWLNLHCTNDLLLKQFAISGVGPDHMAQVDRVFLPQA
jgi:hypothetical protein